MYSIPLHRATIYIFGILLGYSMRMYPNVKFSKVNQLRSIYTCGLFSCFLQLGFLLLFCAVYFIFQMQLVYGWSISTLLFVCSLYGPAKMGNLHYKYNAYDAAIYAALSPVAWCSIFAWIIYTTHIGYTSKILNCFTENIERCFSLYMQQWLINIF